MELDKRIKSIDSIRSFNTNNDDCLGKFGYFTNYITNFDDLNLSIRKGICVFKDGERFPFYCGDQKSHYCDDQKFQFFVPESELLPKEKQYRPYTFKEFTDKFTIGRPIKFRPKGEVGSESYLILNGYSHNQLLGETTTDIYIGRGAYTLDELFSKYEWQEHYTEDFKPFGVEE